MKKYVFGLFLATAFTGSLSAQVTIDETNFPDPKFMEAVTAFDLDGDNTLSEEEIAAVTRIDVENKGITDMTGLEHFTALKTLLCSRNKDLTALNVSKNVNLTSIWFNNCAITSLDVSALTNLKTLICNYNKLTTLDLSNNLLLTELQCIDNSISSLTLPEVQPNSTNTKLTWFTVTGNPIGSIDVTKYTGLKTLNVGQCGLNELDITKNKILNHFECYRNNISDLDVSNNVNLTFLWCFENQIKELDVTKLTKLQSLDCNNNELEVLNLTNCPNLNVLNCVVNHLTTLDLSKNEKLTTASIGGQTKVVDVTAINFEGLGVEVLPSSESSELSKELFYGVNGPGANEGEIDYLEIDGKRYFIFGKPTADTDLYDKTVTYKFNSQCPNEKVKDAPLLVTLTTYPYVMYVNPLSADVSDGFFSGTIYLDYDAVVPEGAEAYIATGITLSKDEMVKDGAKVVAEQLTMTKVADAGEVIPANTPVYVKAAENSGLFDFARNLEELEPVTIPEGNILEGTLVDKTVEPKSVLTLGREQEQGTGEIGFWQFTGTKIPAHRVYIDASLMSNDNGANGFFFNFDGNTDTVEKVAVESVNADNAWYNLQGMQLKNAPASQGIYIHNGKKVVVK